MSSFADPNIKKIAVDARPLSNPLSGVARVISRVIKYYPNKKGVQFILYSNRTWHPDFDDIINLPNVVWMQGRGITASRAGLWFNLTLPGILRKSKIDVFWGSQQVIPPFFPESIPVVLTYYDLVLYLFPESMRLLARLQQKFFQKYSVQRAKYILTISEQTRQDLITHFQIPEEITRTALLGYEPMNPASDKSGKSGGDPSNGRVVSPLPFEGPFILSVSTLEPRKNYSTLLDAYEYYLKGEIENPYPLVIAGRRGWETGEFFKKLDDLIKQTGLVYVIEGLSDGELAWLYEKAAFFCMPSLYEGFGLPLLEALAAGKYALVSDIGSFHEIGGEYIAYLSPKDVDIWALAIRETVDLHRRRKLKRIEFPLDEWSWERTARIHQEAFELVLK